MKLKAYYKGDFDYLDGPFKFSMKEIDDKMYFVMDEDPDIRYPLDVPFLDSENWIVEEDTDAKLKMYLFSSGNYTHDYVLIAESKAKAIEKLKNSWFYKNYTTSIDELLEKSKECEWMVEEQLEDEVLWISNEN